MKSKRTVIWLSPLTDECQVCHNRFGSTMYDACLGPSQGMAWGNICDDCFNVYGCRLGTGFGQKYKRQLYKGKTEWVKVEG